MSTTVTSGIAFLVRVNTGTEAVPVWTTVGGQRNATLTRATASIDASSKDDALWPRLLPGRRSWSIAFDGLLIENDAGGAALDAAYQNNQRVQVQLQTPSNVRLQGFAILEDFVFVAPVDAEATASGTLQGASALARLT